MKQKKRIPKFKTEEEERKFWETHDSTDYVDYSKAERVLFPNLNPDFALETKNRDDKDAI